MCLYLLPSQVVDPAFVDTDMCDDFQTTVSLLLWVVLGLTDGSRPVWCWSGYEKEDGERKRMGLHKPRPRRQPRPGITAGSWPQSNHCALIDGHHVPGYYGSLCAGIMAPRDLATV